MKSLLIASVMAIALTSGAALAETVNIKLIESTPMVVVDQGLGCVNFDDMRAAYMNRDIMIELLETRRCFIVEPGETLQVIDGSYRDNVVNLHYKETTEFTIPAFVFGESDKFK